mgnify:CR=1 FL=1
MEFEMMVDELKSTTSKLDKEEILEYYLIDRYEDVPLSKFLLREAFDPNLRHHVVMKKSDLPTIGENTLTEIRVQVRNLFGRLHDELSPAKNKASVQRVMMKLTRNSQEILLGVVNKKLRCGVSIKTINKVCPDLIPVIPIALAKSYSPKNEHLYSSQLYSSYKLDGQRVFCIRDHKGWSKHSRAGDYLGNKITTLGHWDEELEKYHESTGMNFLDGEAYKHGMTFEAITGLIKSNVNKKDATILEYHIFFAGKTLDLKSSAEKNSILGIPPETLDATFKKYKKLVGIKNKKILNDESAIYEEVDAAVAKGYEGVMLRSTETLYDFKRSHSLVKAKKSDLSGTVEEIDACVVDIEYGEFVVREDGKERVENLPVALWVVIDKSNNAKKMEKNGKNGVREHLEPLTRATSAPLRVSSGTLYASVALSSS